MKTQKKVVEIMETLSSKLMEARTRAQKKVSRAHDELKDTRLELAKSMAEDPLCSFVWIMHRLDEIQRCERHLSKREGYLRALDDTITTMVANFNQ